MLKQRLQRWRELRNSEDVLAELAAILRLHPLERVGALLEQEDLARIGKALEWATRESWHDSPGWTMALGVLAVLAARIEAAEGVLPLLLAVLHAPVVPVQARATAAWACGYLRLGAARPALEQLAVAEAMLRQAVQEALRELESS